MSGTALVVDDSRAMRMILARILRELDYQVMDAGNGREALARLEACRNDLPNFALVDWNMPEMNGLELVQALRANPVFASLPVVMVTTETEMTQIARALDAGANEYVMKPFTSDAIVAKLELLGIRAAA